MTFDDKFGCNQKYIVEEILKQNLPIDIVWVANKDNAEGFPEGVRTVRRASADMYREQATAKVWLDNALSCLCVKSCLCSLNGFNLRKALVVLAKLVNLVDKELVEVSFVLLVVGNLL